MASWRSCVNVPDCVERLIRCLSDVGVPVRNRKDGLLIGCERNARTVMFWESKGLWHVGHLDRVDQNPVPALTTTDREVALRWFLTRDSLVGFRWLGVSFRWYCGVGGLVVGH